MAKKSKYFGVTFDARAEKWKAQIFIAGKPRFFGYHDDEEVAGQVAENARLHLQAFFPKSPAGDRHFDIVATTAAIETVRGKLIDEKAPTYTHLPVGAETVPDEIERLFDEVQQAQTALQHTIRRLSAAINRSSK
jgi:hypothetical protein